MLARWTLLVFTTACLCAGVKAQDEAPVTPPAAAEPNEFEQARKKAADERKYLLVVVAGSDADSRNFLDQTLKAEEVVKWIDARGVLLVFSYDEPIGKNFAAAHEIGEVPTLLVMASDGRELGRQTGFAEAKRLLIRINGATQSDAIRSGPGMFSWAGEDVVLAAMDRAAKLTKDRKFAEAFDEYQWCFEHRATQSPVFPVVHMPKLVAGLAALARQYEPAMTDLRHRIASAENEALKSNRPEVYAYYLLKYAYTELNESEKLVAFYDRLDKRSPDGNNAATFARLIYNPLLAARRYEAIKQTVLDEADVDLFLEESGKMNRDRAETLVLLGNRYEVLLGVGMVQDAKNLAAKVLDYDRTAQAYLALAEGALRSHRSSDDDIRYARSANEMAGSLSAKPVIVLAKLLIQRSQADPEATQLIQQAQQRLTSKADQDALIICLSDIQSRKVPPRLPAPSR